MTDICCIGHITSDKIITPKRETYLNGGTSFYFSYALNKLGGKVTYKLVTSLAEKDFGAVDDMRKSGIDVDVIPSRNTVFFENRYEENMNNRTQRVLAKADPFTIDSLKNIEARYIHLGSLLADDFSSDVIRSLAGKGILSVDAQGFLRYVDGEKVLPCDWSDKKEVFPYIDILKVNEFEIESLTGSTDPVEAGKILASWGIKESLITLGSYGSVIYCDGKHYDIPAYKPKELVDATGCGDTYAAGYLYMRAQGEGIRESGCFAAAMSSIKLEKVGPFTSTAHDVFNVIKNSR